MAGATSPCESFETESATVTGSVSSNHTVAAAIVAATNPMIPIRLTLHRARLMAPISLAGQHHLPERLSGFETSVGVGRLSQWKRPVHDGRIPSAEESVCGLQ